MEKLKNCGFTEIEAKDIIEDIDFELEKLTQELATYDHLKKFQSTLEEKMTSASSFVTSTSPFQVNFSSALTSKNSFPSAVDPVILEKEIKTTGQQLNDEIKQLQADFQLDANLEAKRREEVDAALLEKLSAASDYASQSVQHLNENLDRVSRQVIVAIGGTIVIRILLVFKLFFRIYWCINISIYFVFIIIVKLSEFKTKMQNYFVHSSPKHCFKMSQ